MENCTSAQYLLPAQTDRVWAGREGGTGGVLDLVSQLRDVVLMNVYLDLGDPGGSGFWNEGYMGKGREMGRSVYEKPGNEVDRSYYSKEGSK
jgi:hypothetical protein